MANVRFGGGITDIRGSMAGNTFARGMGGAVLRQRVKGVNRRSNGQELARGRQSRLAVYWSKTLTTAERLEWRNWASTTTWQNKLGDNVTITGLAAFIAVNGLRLAAGLAITTPAPTQPGHAGAAPITATATVADGKINITAIGGTFDETKVTDRVLIFAGPGQSKGSLGNSKNLKFFHLVSGVQPTQFPLALTYPGTLLAGNPVTIESVHLDDTNRPGTREKLVLIPS